MALLNACQKATAMAGALGQSIGKVHLIKEKDIPVNNWYLEKNIRTTEILTESYIQIPGIFHSVRYRSKLRPVEVGFSLFCFSNL